MTAKDSLLFIATGITAAACIAFILILVHAVWYAPDGEVSAGVPVPESARILSGPSAPAGASSTAAFAGYPSRLVIPAIKVNAYVKQVGLTADGAMATPGNFVDVGWYKYGTVPGEAGSAVIDGHVDNGLALAGVFKHLSDLKIGDDVYIETDSGQELHFRVSDVKAYFHDTVPADSVFNDASGTRLKLITCTGSWISSAKTYDQRLVVTADKV